ncbi:hypothetical protein IX56_03455 [Paracoccus sanguinis]|uniref:Uncharacterized protein n=1 Tax=Paracoccus sanguinis TaxID=1545044 RepID=A0A099GK41_9RHOB|nr:hypothetical protein IX56_03455 [Paracoccus sanguinis]
MGVFSKEFLFCATAFLIVDRARIGDEFLVTASYLKTVNFSKCRFEIVKIAKAGVVRALQSFQHFGFDIVLVSCYQDVSV